eukprot:2745331-Amphidinium_carterae.1
MIKNYSIGSWSRKFWSLRSIAAGQRGQERSGVHAPSPGRGAWHVELVTIQTNTIPIITIKYVHFWFQT